MDCANCEAGRDLRRFSSGANVFGGGKWGFFGRRRRGRGRRRKEVQKIEEVCSFKGEEEEDLFDHMPGFANFKSRKLEANKVNILKEERRLTPRKRILRYVI